MSYFLLLPREIRDTIISVVITDPKPPPANATVECSRTLLKDIKYRGWSNGNGVKYPASAESYRPSSLALLLTNHQLHAEINDLLRKRPIRCALDVMLVDESELWPTWTFLPTLATRIDTVEATIRIVSQGLAGDSAFRDGDGGPPQIIWFFYTLLERFLKVGPVGPLGGKVSTLKEIITVRTLELNLETPRSLPLGTEIEPLETAGEANENWFNPERLADFLASYMHALLNMGYHTAYFGALLYARIGEIRLTHDRRLVEKWDLGRLLGEFPPEGPHKTFENRRLAHFPDWRAKAFHMRAEAGI